MSFGHSDTTYLLFKRGIQFSSLLSIELVSFIGKFDLHILSYNPHPLSVCLVVLQNTL